MLLRIIVENSERDCGVTGYKEFISIKDHKIKTPLMGLSIL